jgi:arginyl-tRNA synthetase
MATLPDILRDRFSAAIASALGDEHAQTDPIITSATNAQFGDFQVNVAMGLAKKLGRKPRELADAIVAKLDGSGLLAEPPSVAGPGFINLRVDPALLSQLATQLASDDRLGVAAAEPPQRVVVDYSAPNVAKEMHIGHLRSTIIGDCIARTLACQGHVVIRQNHLGDWGTQFGMLIEHLLSLTGGDGSRDSVPAAIGDLNAFYQDAKRHFDNDPAFAERARKRVVALQAGDAETRSLWRKLYDTSISYFNATYARMNVLLTDTDIRGESAYNDALPDVVRELEALGLASMSDGAVCVFPAGFVDKDGQPLPMIVRKSDGGYLYATTDLAAARYRVRELEAQRLVYVADARQSQHFAMLFAVLRQANWAPPELRLDHVPFGTVLGKDRRPFKTREGGTVKLADVLDEAERRAFNLVSAKNVELPEGERRSIAHIVGIGALKYADLSSDRIKDYVFDWDRMLALEGNTAPYLQYSYTRIRSIFRKAGEPIETVEQSRKIVITAPSERVLALKLLTFGAVVQSVADALEPHRLCTYLYELASAFHQFYEQCPVLTAPETDTRGSRLALCDLTGRTLKQGLSLLGIDVPERM